MIPDKSKVAEFLGHVNAVLKGAGLEPQASADGVTFASTVGVTTVKAEQDEASASEQRVGTTAVTTTLQSPPESLDAQQLSWVNSMAGLSALVKDEQSGDFVISTRLQWHEEVVGPTGFAAAAFVAAVALLQSDTIIGVMKVLTNAPYQPLDLDGKADGIEELGADLARSETYLKTHEIQVFSGADELTAELPWQKKGLSAIAGAMTSLLQLNGTQTHPILGRGLAYRITLPEVRTRRQDSKSRSLAELANFLNNCEMLDKSPAGPGAWSVCNRPQPDTLSFSGFIPTFCYSQGMALLVVDWMRRKHNSTAFMIKEFQARGAL